MTTSKTVRGAAAARESAAAPEPARPPEPTTPPEPAGSGFQLYVLRHADAGDPADWSGDDADRPLSKKGRRQAKRLGGYLRSLKVRPDAVITSPKLRAADTAKLVAKRLAANVSTDPRLAAEFGSDDLAAVLAELGAGVASAILVGHDPDFSSLVSWLIGAPVALRKGALARVDLPDRSVGPGRGSLRWLLPPDAIPN